MLEKQWKDASVIIWGSGFLGRDLLHKCIDKGIRPVAFVDNNKKLQGTYIEGIPVLSFPALFSLQNLSQARLLVTVRDVNSILEQIGKSLPCENILFLDDLYNLDEIPNTWSFLERHKLEAGWYYHASRHTDRILLRTVDFVITERCSLRCRECSNLMQYYQHPQNYALETLKKDFQRLLWAVDEIYEVRLIGGEPFMHPQMQEFLTFLNGERQVHRVCIYTNGTILPADDVLRTIVQGGKTWLSVSDYGDLSRNLKELLAKLDSYGIGYEHKPVDYWTRCASFERHRRSEQENRRVFYECCAKDLLTFQGGRLYPCPFSANATQLHAIPDFTGDYIDFREDRSREEFRYDMEKMREESEFYQACDYCLGRPSVTFVKEEDKIPPHEQTKQPLPYEKLF